VIAGHVDHLRAGARLAQDFLHHLVLRFGPVPGAFEPPPVDDIADQVDRVGIDMAQEVEQIVGLAAARAQMRVGNPDRAVPADAADPVHG
jgi:hypothetical protein